MNKEYVLSFDIGIKNLAYCLICGDSVTAWKIVDISFGKSKPTFEDLCSNLVHVLDDIRSSIVDPSKVTVLIENQPAFKAPTMRSIQIFIFAYFKLTKGVYVPKLVSASTKNTFMKKHGYELKPKDYKSNKHASIECVTTYLSAKDMQNELALLHASSKKDDLCDCLLQAMACTDVL